MTFQTKNSKLRNFLFYQAIVLIVGNQVLVGCQLSAVCGPNSCTARREMEDSYEKYEKQRFRARTEPKQVEEVVVVVCEGIGGGGGGGGG